MRFMLALMMVAGWSNYLVSGQWGNPTVHKIKKQMEGHRTQPTPSEVDSSPMNCAENCERCLDMFCQPGEAKSVANFSCNLWCQHTHELADATNLCGVEEEEVVYECCKFRPKYLEMSVKANSFKITDSVHGAIYCDDHNYCDPAFDIQFSQTGYEKRIKSFSGTHECKKDCFSITFDIYKPESKTVDDKTGHVIIKDERVYKLFFPDGEHLANQIKDIGQIIMYDEDGIWNNKDTITDYRTGGYFSFNPTEVVKESVTIDLKIFCQDENVCGFLKLSLTVGLKLFGDLW